MNDLQKLDARLSHFSAEGADEFKRVLGAYGSALLDECERLEASDRNGSGSPEITAVIVSRANSLFQESKRLNLNGRPHWMLRVSAGVSPILTGLICALADLNSPNGLTLALISGGVSLVTVTALLMKETS